MSRDNMSKKSSDWSKYNSKAKKRVELELYHAHYLTE